MNCLFTFPSQTVNTITKKLLILYLLLNQFFISHFNFPLTLTKQQPFTASESEFQIVAHPARSHFPLSLSKAHRALLSPPISGGLGAWRREIQDNLSAQQCNVCVYTHQNLRM